MTGVALRGIVLALVLVVPACTPGEDGQDRAAGYADVLVRELRMDRDLLEATRDSIEAKHAQALLWIDWIDEVIVTGSGNLMEGAKSLGVPVELALRRRVVTELDLLDHWSLIPDPALREDLVLYHQMAGGFPRVGRDEVVALRRHLSSVLDRREWNWMYDVPTGEPPIARFKDTVPLLFNDDFRAQVRLVAIALQEQRVLVEELLTLNETLEDRARAWRSGVSDVE